MILLPSCSQFRSLANTPYSAELKAVGVEAASGQESQDQAHGSQQNEQAGPNLSSSLNYWLQQSFPIIQDLRVMLYLSLHNSHCHVIILFIVVSAYIFRYHLHFLCYIHHSVLLHPIFFCVFAKHALKNPNVSLFF